MENKKDDMGEVDCGQVFQDVMRGADCGQIFKEEEV